MKTTTDKLKDAVAANLTDILDLVSKVRRTKGNHNDGQNSATMFQKRAKDIRYDQNTGRKWARQDYQGTAQVTCPYCDCESMHWMDGGHDTLPSGIPIVDIKFRPKKVADLEKEHARRFNKAGSMREQMAAEDNKNAEREAAPVAATTAEMTQVDREVRRTTDMAPRSHGVYRPNIVDVEDKTLVDGKPIPQAHVNRMSDGDIATLIAESIAQALAVAPAK